MITFPDKSNILLEIVRNHKSGIKTGIYSICSSNKYVLKAAIDFAKKNNSLLLIEATSNQVDQFGGYMGMTPIQFRNYINVLLDECGYGEENVILGGDHLGPNTWQNLSAVKAMENSKHLISTYIKAGFKKIHLDTSFVCEDDSVDEHGLLSKAVISNRAAELCKVAEDEISNSDIPGKVVYVIGTEVPKPGGMSGSEIKAPEVSTVESTEETINLSQAAFKSFDLHDAWHRVIAVVTHPGVEFGDRKVFEYDRSKSTDLVEFIEKDTNLVYEAHSTDYQSDKSLQELVEDHFAVLKVGPALTFAFRDMLFKLEEIEIELTHGYSSIQISNLSKVIETEMLKNPKYWINHYTGSDEEIAYARINSLSDRIRYYWSNPTVNKSVQKLIDNLSRESSIPDSLLEKLLPDQYLSIKDGKITNKPESLINHRIQQVIKPYSIACGMS